jgi:16S rRNA (adenine1518-N6/adenine1519-N6)-dimethyltransferase
MTTPIYKKRYGQHHLRSGVLCRPLIEFLRPEGQRVLEIGPGGGVLTAELLAVGARVLAVEVDAEWAFELRRRLPEHGLHTVVLDALRFPWERLPTATLAAGNLPFNVGTRLIEDLLPHHQNIPRAGFMLQKEVADRLVARPSTKAYGALTVLVEAHARTRYLGTVRPGSFHPPPKVAAAFVGLELRPPPFEEEGRKEFRRLVHLAFGQRRKTLRNALASGIGREMAAAVVAAAGLNERVRAEALGLEEMLGLFVAWRAAMEPPPAP